jgi:septal ring factor EnvC (AmiA/AmiB activator)
MIRFIILILSLLLVSTPLLLSSEDQVNKKRAELEKLNEEINSWERKIETREKREHATLELLDNYDKQLILLRKLIKRLRGDDYALQYEIDQTKTKVAELDNQLNYIKRQFAKYVTTAYKHGRTYDLELLISSKSVNQLYVRSLYLKKFSEQRKKDVDKIYMRFSELAKQNELLQKQVAEQRQILESKSGEEQKLTGKLNSRKKILTDIRKDKKNYQREIERKRNAAKDLEDLITKLIELDRKRDSEERLPKSETEITSSEFSKSGPPFEIRRGKLPWPVTKGKVVAKFGTQQHPVLKTISQNTGIDISVPTGTNVYNIADGEVATIWWLPSFGNLVIVNHHNGYRTVYAHLSDIEVTEGDKVSEGSRIGRSGESITGSLVHFEIWKNRDKQDPELWLHPQNISRR